ncbi:MAG: protein TolR [Proteobacteria bacterium]|nr:protein TolR [Pseudomonadota bacterium]
MRPRRLKNEINVVPYIDVMLVLLVIFMVTAPMMTTANIDLPTVGKAAQQAEKPLEVIIRADRTLALRDLARGGNERDLGRRELAQAVLEAQARNPEQPVLISADRNVKYEAVLEIMDDLQRQQVRRVALNVQISGK